MTEIHTPAEAAREAARVAGGQFGEQQHTAPDPAVLNPQHPLDVTLDKLSWVHRIDAYQEEKHATRLRVASFVADAHVAVPEAVRAVFAWDYDGSEPRLCFSHYEDAEGEETDGADGSYPDVFDFDVDDEKEAAMYGFVRAADGATLTFDDIAIPDAARAQAELLVAEKLDHEPDSTPIRHLLGKAMDLGLDPAKVEQLTDAQVARIREILAQAAEQVQSAVE